MKETEIKETHCFGENLKQFLLHIESLSTSLPLVIKTIDESNLNAIKTHSSFLKNECELKDGEKNVYTLKPEQISKNEKLKKIANQTKIAHVIVQRNFIVSLVSQYDAFIGSLIRTMYYFKPELLNSSEKQLTFSNLVSFNSIENAREYIIEKEIESVLRENHTEHFKWIENKLNIKLRKDLNIWSTFIELTERRNLYVHNNGKVNNQYLKICSDNSYEFKDKPNIGDELHVDSVYFESAFKCLYELAVKLSQVIWRNLQPDELLKCDDSLLDITYELILDKKYDLAKILLDFMDKYIKKFSSDDIKYRLIFNRAQTYKWLGDEKKCLEIVKSSDWSASNDLFKLASQVLIDDFEKASETMKRIGSNQDILPKLCYLEWPIFNKFRKNEIFLKTYKEIYKEEPEIREENINAT
jgi:hypothetical protein